MARTKGVRLLITGVFLIFVAGSVLLFVRMHDGAADACVGVAIEVDGTRRLYLGATRKQPAKEGELFRNFFIDSPSSYFCVINVSLETVRASFV